MSSQKESHVTRLLEGMGLTGALPPLKIGDKEARVPIIQGGMGVCISLGGLAAAVANEGGVGVIAANGIGMSEPDYHRNTLTANIRALRREIRRARAASTGLIGVNIMVALDNFPAMLTTAVEEGVDFLFLGAGLPLRGIPVAAIRTAGVKVVPIVSSARAADVILRFWASHYHDLPDAFVVEGPLAGGHLGFSREQLADPDFALERLIPPLVATLKDHSAKWGKELPLIAGGGVYTGEDIHRMIRLGASGVQMGTRFVATRECDADPRFKAAYVACRPEDIVIIDSPVGMPGRAIRSPFLDGVAAGEAKPFRCPARCIGRCGAREARYCISAALDHARRGEWEAGFAFCGANAHRVSEVVPVRELMDGLRREFRLAAIRDGLRRECEALFQRVKTLSEESAAIIGQALADSSWGRRPATAGPRPAGEPVTGAAVGNILQLVREEYAAACLKLADIQQAWAEMLGPTPDPRPV